MDVIAFTDNVEIRIQAANSRVISGKRHSRRWRCVYRQWPAIRPSARVETVWNATNFAVMLWRPVCARDVLAGDADGVETSETDAGLATPHLLPYNREAVRHIRHLAVLRRDSRRSRRQSSARRFHQQPYAVDLTD